MTEEIQEFIEKSVQETETLFNEQLNDVKFMEDRTNEIVELMVNITRKTEELKDANATQEELLQVQNDYVNSMSEQQLDALKNVYDRLAESRQKRIKALADMDLETFKEVSFEITKRELKIMTNFSRVLMQAVEQPLIDALQKLEEEMDEKDSDQPSEPRIFNIDNEELIN